MQQFMYVVYINLLYFLSIFLFTYNKNLLSQKKQNAPKSIFINFFSMEHFLQHPQKGVCNEIFTTKETCPPTLNFVYCFTGFI